jgi:hypothetical protein
MTTPYEQARIIAQALLKSEPPPFTVDLLRQQVEKAGLIVPLTPDEVDQLVKDLEVTFSVWIGVGKRLDDNTEHAP